MDMSLAHFYIIVLYLYLGLPHAAPHNHSSARRAESSGRRAMRATSCTWTHTNTMTRAPSICLCRSVSTRGCSRAHKRYLLLQLYSANIVKLRYMITVYTSQSIGRSTRPRDSMSDKMPELVPSHGQNWRQARNHACHYVSWKEQIQGRHKYDLYRSIRYLLFEIASLY
jgi:hypothetical protein